MSVSLSVSLKTLTRDEMVDIAGRLMDLPHTAKMRKDLLVEYIAQQAASMNIDNVLHDAISHKLAAKTQAREAKAMERRRRNVEAMRARREADRVERTQAARRETDHFMQLPTKTQVKDCYSQFFEATSTTALAHLVCAVCAREVLGTTTTQVPIADIPNAARLRPAEAHAAHTLYNGCLLEPAGVVDDQVANICESCFADLRTKDSQPPKFSLANGLWVGPVPEVLNDLTVPEQLLIALVYPRVYVFKLFPRLRGYKPPEESLQRAMRGTVSTFEVDSKGVVAMLEGNLMPRKPEILASLISVTFVGSGKMPRNWLKNTFRVRRRRIADALCWLHEHNPRYYGDIVVSKERLSLLPEDDIPDVVETIVRQCEDDVIIEREHGGYVPAEGATDDVPVEESRPEHVTEQSDDANEDPAVIPLQLSGSVDVDLSRMTSSEIMQWGMSNLWQQGGEGGYVFRHGRQPVRDLPVISTETDITNTGNLFERAFPCLFPYGMGGIERGRAVKLDFHSHIRWCYELHDRCFRRHETFGFYSFGISQRRQALGSARVQMRRQDFERDARLMATITPEIVKQAQDEEAAGLPFSHPAICTLRRHLLGTAGRVQGTDQSRQTIRSQIWSTCLVHGPPAIWLTINPCDLHDPIAQLFAGEAINMDDLLSSVGPDAKQRAINIANDAYASAKFFHFLIDTIFETLFQIKVTSHSVTSGMGVLGQLAAYIGAVETQGRAALHQHCIIWLLNAPSPEEILQLLTSTEFRDKIRAFIASNIRAYLPGMENATAMAAIPKDREVAYNRPPNPLIDNYDEVLQDFELRVARTEQIHSCRIGRCLKYDKRGGLRCKRRAPFPVIEDDFVEQSGKWGQKRLYEFVNAWNPAVLVNARCNNDIKLLTNGEETRSVAYYVGGYALKKQQETSNISAIIADGFAYHIQHPKPEYVQEIREQQRLLLFRLVNTVNREQELAGPMVVSYLMGWGDVKRSHIYSPIYWSSFVGALCHLYPGLRNATRLRRDAAIRTATMREAELGLTGVTATVEEAEVMPGTSIAPVEQVDLAESFAAEDGNERVTLELDTTGRLTTSSQTNDYRFRGASLENMNVYDFFKDTYETTISRDTRRANHGDTAQEGVRRRGRPANERASYLEGHPQSGTKLRVKRSGGHRNIPNIIGRWFPRRDDEDTYDLYCASMLTLLKPWRDLRTDLKREDQTWSAAFEEWQQTCEDGVKFVMSNIQYYHECASAATAERNGGESREGRAHAWNAPEVEFDDEEDVDDEDPDTQMSEEGLKALKASQVPWREYLHGRVALETAKHVGIFEDNAQPWSPSTEHKFRNATDEDIGQLLRWKAHMEKDILSQDVQQGQPLHNADGGAGASVGRLDDDAGSGSPTVTGTESLIPEDVLSAVDPSELRPDQRRAFDMVAWHLDQTLKGAEPPPLRMVLYGEGGTGKSKVIQTITEEFERRGVAHMLIKAAFTGIAASLINGKTTHTIARLSLDTKSKVSDTSKAELEAFWRSRSYLIIDEYSMISKSFLARLSENIGIGKETAETDLKTTPFGNINVILCGDLHQFAPVSQFAYEALFKPVNVGTDTADAMIGRRLYEGFDTVVILKEQMRVTDPVWRQFLVHLRHGEVEDEDLDMLQKLVLGEEGAEVDFASAPWKEACLVTPRHSVREPWNASAVRKWCRASGERLFVVKAEDQINGRPLTLRERYALAGRGKRDRKDRRRSLPETVELARGMKVMVTTNIHTDLDVANGSRGEIVDIILHPDEPAIGAEGVVELKYMPLYLLVKLSRTRASKLEGLEECVIPIEPSSVTMQISVTGNAGGAPLRRTVRRRQFSVTGAYAFTDYRAQGQTIPIVLIDIQTPPPPGTLTLFNLYVALSRSSGRDTIRLLRQFDRSLFLKSHDPDLKKEDERLEVINKKTKYDWEQFGKLVWRRGGGQGEST